MPPSMSTTDTIGFNVVEAVFIMLSDPSAFWQLLKARALLMSAKLFVSVASTVPSSLASKISGRWIMSVSSMGVMSMNGCLQFGQSPTEAARRACTPTPYRSLALQPSPPGATCLRYS